MGEGGLGREGSGEGGDVGGGEDCRGRRDGFWWGERVEERILWEEGRGWRRVLVGRTGRGGGEPRGPSAVGGKGEGSDGGASMGLVTSLTPHMSPEQRIRYDEQRAGFPEHTTESDCEYRTCTGTQLN